MKTLSHLLLILVLPACALAQDYKRTFNWYFGYNAGLNFYTTPPTNLTNGELNSVEASASISDTNGNLQFYTDGRTVYNRNHQIMQNGTGLLSDKSASQGAIIVPKPNSENLYYIFTNNQGNPCYYSIVDMNLDSGQGVITTKNIVLISNTTEKIAVTKHSNNIDYWIVTHDYTSSKFYCFLLTENGIVNCPVINEIGKIYTGSTHAAGQMKFSLKGDKIAITTWVGFDVELYDFDKTKGTLSNFKKITGLFVPYGVEFSPDGSRLYIMENQKKLFQLDLSSGNDTVISNSKVEIFQPFPTKQIQGLQIAPNGKIYLATVDTFLSAITQPDSIGLACGFIEKEILLAPKRCAYTLPSFVSSFFYKPQSEFEYKIRCNEKIVDFNAKDTFNATSHKWTITNFNTNTNVALTGKSLTHQFSDSGFYNVSLIVSNGIITDTVSKVIYMPQQFSLGNDTGFCSNGNVILRAGQGRCYSWQNGSGNNQFIADTPGTYYVSYVDANFCIISDTITISKYPDAAKPTISKILDTLYSSSALSYKWFYNNSIISGANKHFYVLQQNGFYKVEIKNQNGCYATSDSFYVNNVGITISEKPLDDIFIFPNPTQNEINIRTREVIEEFRLLDIVGRTKINLLSINKKELQFNSLNLAKGTYFIQIKTDRKTYNQKIIIQ